MNDNNHKTTMTTTMKHNRKRTRVASLVIAVIALLTVQLRASAFTAIQQSQRPWSNRNRNRNQQPSTRRYLEQKNSNSNINKSRRRPDQGVNGSINNSLNSGSNSQRKYKYSNSTEMEENDNDTSTPFTAGSTNGASSSSVSYLDDENDNVNESKISSVNLREKQKELELQSLDQIQQNKIESMEMDNAFQNEIDQDNAQIAELKQNIRDFLKEPLVEVLDCSLVLLSSLLVAVSTLPDLAHTPAYQNPIQFAENTIGSVFAVEFLARWFSDVSSKQRGLLYFAQPIVLVDIVAVILPLLFATQPSSFWADSTFIPNWLTSSSGLINLRLLRILRLQRVLQDMDTFTKFEMALGISDSNVKAWQLQLARTVLSIFTLLSVSTGLIYTAEHDVNPNIPDYFTALYFGLTTLTTVGFGDIVPVSWEGRLVVSGSILAGVAVIPAQAAVLVEALLARQEEQKAAQQARSQAANSETEATADALGAYGADGNSNPTDSIATTATPTTSFDPIRQEVAAQAAKRRHAMVHGSTSTANNNSDNDNVTQGRMVLETEFACPSCGVSMHWSSAKFCWSCGHKI